MPSPTRTCPDEAATAEQIAETGLWVAVEQPLLERWLEVALVVDVSMSMTIWQKTIAELTTLLQDAGVFGDVRVWRMDGDLRQGGKVTISGQPMGDTFGRDPRELIDPAQRRVVLVVSDCVGTAWLTGAMAEPLSVWSGINPVAILHMLPQRLWVGCPPEFTAVRLRSTEAGVPNVRLVAQARHGDLWVDGGVPIPVFELEARWMKPWASLVAGTGGQWINGMAVFTGRLAKHSIDIHGVGYNETQSASPGEQLRRFRAQASPEAYELLVHLAAAPLSLDVIRLVQGAILPASRPCHLAEVFLSGLLRRVAGDGDDDERLDEVEYGFQPGVRAELLNDLARQDALRVLSHVSRYVSERMGSPLDFRALLTLDQHYEPPEVSRPFARVAYEVLRRLGGRYEEAAERLTRRSGHGSVEPQEPDSAGDDLLLPTESEGDTLTTSGPPFAETNERRPRMAPGIIHGLPSRNPRFTGRRDLLWRLRQELVDNSQRTALLPHTLHGLGGVGKTQLAIEYVWQYSRDYDLISWVPADDTTQVRAALAELGQAMALPEGPDIRRTVDIVLDALRTNAAGLQWLLVFDNADDPENLRPYLPYPSGHVLITSRNTSWSEVANTLEVDVFDRAESVELLRTRTPELSVIDADMLADRLGDLPLALEQAAAWLAETGMQVAEYLALFEEQFQKLMADPPIGYPVSLAATYQVPLSKLREQSPAAAQLLAVCSFLGPAPIRTTLLRDGGGHADIPSPLDHTISDPISLRAAVREIGRYALARMDSDRDEITIHRLVQLVVRAHLDAHDRKRFLHAAQDILARANRSEPDNELNWFRHLELSSHIVPSGLIEAESEAARRAVLDQIRYRWMRGDYESSEELGKLTVQAWRRRWSADDQLTLIAQRHLCNALHALGKYDEARALAKSTLDQMLQVLGQNDRHTLATADMVAWGMRIQGDLQAARQIDENNLELCRQAFGESDPLTLQVAHNFAIDLRWLGDFEGARARDEDSLRLRTRVYGPDNWRTMMSTSAVNRDLCGLGEYEIGLHLQEATLGAQTQILGNLHHVVLLETRNLAILQRKAGHYSLALSTIENLCETYARRFGSNHEHTLAAMLSYSNALRDSRELERARKVGEETLAHYQRLFGSQHAVTLACAANLAIIRRQLGDVVSALALNEAALDAFTRLLSPDHPFTLCCAVHLSSDLAGLGRQDAARDRSEQTLPRAIAVWGEGHPYTLACQLNTALDRVATGGVQDGETLFEQATLGFERKLGPEHPATRAAIARTRLDCDIEPPET